MVELEFLCAPTVLASPAIPFQTSILTADGMNRGFGARGPYSLSKWRFRKMYG